MKQYETLEQIIASDVMGLLDTECTISRWGIICGGKGCEKLTLQIRFRSYARAQHYANASKEEGFVGCIFREIKKDGEWILTATEEF